MFELVDSRDRSVNVCLVSNERIDVQPLLEFLSQVA